MEPKAGSCIKNKITKIDKTLAKWTRNLERWYNLPISEMREVTYTVTLQKTLCQQIQIRWNEEFPKS